jgi:hypothetical protein
MNIQEYVVNQVIDHLKEKNIKIEYFDQHYNIQKCGLCEADIVIKKTCQKLYKHGEFRRCEYYRDEYSRKNCNFILCSKCWDRHQFYAIWSCHKCPQE